MLICPICAVGSHEAESLQHVHDNTTFSNIVLFGVFLDEVIDLNVIFVEVKADCLTFALSVRKIWFSNGFVHYFHLNFS
jgi:hypothetical protein